MNGKHAAGLGAVLLALAALFGFLRGVPWVPREEFAQHIKALEGQLDEIHRDVREIRTFLFGDSRR